MSKNIEKDDNLTVSQVYETLKSPTFLKDLYWDILSGIKEKSTYKLMRESAEKLINQKVEALDSLSDSENDNIMRKTIVAQICSMTYAIDTVYSKILYMKLEKACKLQIPILIHELRQEGKIPDEIWTKFKFADPASKPQDSSRNSEIASQSSESTSKPEEFNKKSIVNSVTEQKLESSNSPSALRGRRKRKLPSKVVEQDKTMGNGGYKTVMPNGDSQKTVNLPKKKLGGRIRGLHNKNADEPVISTPVKELTKENLLALDNPDASIKENGTCATESTSQITKKGKDKDSDSEFSFDNLSFASVSSVHTSDLSSFDDEISVSSGDEGDGQKKRLSIKEVQKKLTESGNLSSNIKQNFNGAKQKKSSKSEKKQDKNPVEVTNEEKEVTTDDAVDSTAEESTSSYLPTDKELPKRARKPNSRYSSANILCTSVKIKERKKPAPTSKNENTEELSPIKKKPKTESEIKIETTNGTPKVNNVESNSDSKVKSPSKPCESSDLNKPHSTNSFNKPTVPSLTTRKTAPVTLFSTAP